MPITTNQGRITKSDKIVWGGYEEQIKAISKAVSPAYTVQYELKEGFQLVFFVWSENQTIGQVEKMIEEEFFTSEHKEQLQELAESAAEVPEEMSKLEQQCRSAVEQILIRELVQKDDFTMYLRVQEII